jgi:hypothetical protein
MAILGGQGTLWGLVHRSILGLEAPQERRPGPGRTRLVTEEAELDRGCAGCGPGGVPPG